MSTASRIDRVIRVVTGIAIAGSLTPLVFFAVYVRHFSSAAAPSDAYAAWGQFGDFLGGVSNPIIAGLSLSVLVITLLQQSKQLSESRIELADSREKLALSQAALAQVAQALTEQARSTALMTQLSTTSTLLSQYSREISYLESLALVPSDGRNERLFDLLSRHTTLQTQLDAIYERLSS